MDYEKAIQTALEAAQDVEGEDLRQIVFREVLRCELHGASTGPPVEHAAQMKEEPSTPSEQSAASQLAQQLGVDVELVEQHFDISGDIPRVNAHVQGYPGKSKADKQITYACAMLLAAEHVAGQQALSSRELKKDIPKGVSCGNEARHWGASDSPILKGGTGRDLRYSIRHNRYEEARERVRRLLGVEENSEE